MSPQPKAAIIGATGIGKHHGKWYHLEGCQVTAFAGSTPESVERTGQAMQQLFGFTGRGYTDVAQLLARERPDLVSVCSPHHLHREHTIAALEAGAAVLCEKPLVWDVAMDRPAMLAQGRLMLEAAHRTGRLLAVNTQYLAVLPVLVKLYESQVGPLSRIERLYCRMESKGGVTGPNQWDEIWIDLGSHPLSLVVGLLPEGKLDEASIDCRIAQDEVTARFQVEGSQGPTQVQIDLRNVQEGTPKRQVGINDLLAEVAGRNDESGVYRTFISAGDAQLRGDDLVHSCIRAFIRAAAGQGQPLASAQSAYRNLDYQLAIFERAQRAP